MNNSSIAIGCGGQGLAWDIWVTIETPLGNSIGVVGMHLWFFWCDRPFIPVFNVGPNVGSKFWSCFYTIALVFGKV
jgi:hypothetical protein